MPRDLRILAVRFGALGDVVLTTPLLRAIRLQHPEAVITFVTKQRYAPLLVGNPAVAETVPLSPGGSVADLARALRRTRWDLRLDLHGNLRSLALRALLGGRWASCGRQRLRRTLLCHWGIDTFRVIVPAAERYFEAARGLGVTPDGRPPDVFTTPEDDARAAAVAPVGGYVALAPGAAHATKLWPGAHWRALAATLLGAGHAVVGVGTAQERTLLNVAGVVDGFGVGLGATAALLRAARAAVANDSGLMHLATAVGTPVVALFGPTVRQLGFFPYRARAVVLERSLPCRPCSASGSAHCPRGDHACMIGIGPEEVAAAVETEFA